MKNFHYEVRQLQSCERFWQGITVVYATPEVDYSFQITQSGKGILPLSNCSFVRGGKMKVVTGGLMDFRSLADKNDNTFQIGFRSNKGYERFENFSDLDLEILLELIAKNRVDKFPPHVADLVRKSIAQEDATVSEFVETNLTEMILPKEITWLANYWGAAA